jgi:hypothetical protein
MNNEELNIERIIHYLNIINGPDDMASVQINNEGLCIIRQGVSHSISMNVQAFKERVHNAC